MPYIRRERKENLLPAPKVEEIGELNYMLTIAAIKYLMDRELNYTNLNAVMGAFDCAAKEFYRRVVVPYEEKKERENGDVYPIELLSPLSPEESAELTRHLNPVYGKDGNTNGDSGPHTLISNIGDSDG